MLSGGQGDDTLAITTDDLGNFGQGGAQQAFDTIALTVQPVNDPPVNSVPPAQQMLAEDTTLTFSGPNAISVSDPDAAEGTGAVRVTLAVAHGALTVAAIGSASVAGNATGSVTIEGLVADVNATLDGLVYAPDANFNGPDTLTVTTNDLGNTGLPGDLEDIDTVDLFVEPVNDAPQNAVPLQQETDEDTSLVFSVADGNAITVSDIDAAEGTGQVRVTLAVGSGTLTAGTPTSSKASATPPS